MSRSWGRMHYRHGRPRLHAQTVTVLCQLRLRSPDQTPPDTTDAASRRHACEAPAGVRARVRYAYVACAIMQYIRNLCAIGSTCVTVPRLAPPARIPGNSRIRIRNRRVSRGPRCLIGLAGLAGEISSHSKLRHRYRDFNHSDTRTSDSLHPHTSSQMIFWPFLRQICLVWEC